MGRTYNSDRNHGQSDHGIHGQQTNRRQRHDPSAPMLDQNGKMVHGLEIIAEDTISRLPKSATGVPSARAGGLNYVIQGHGTKMDLNRFINSGHFDGGSFKNQVIVPVMYDEYGDVKAILEGKQFSRVIHHEVSGEIVEKGLDTHKSIPYVGIEDGFGGILKFALVGMDDPIATTYNYYGIERARLTLSEYVNSLNQKFQQQRKWLSHNGLSPSLLKDDSDSNMVNPGLAEEFRTYKNDQNTLDGLSGNSLYYGLNTDEFEHIPRNVTLENFNVNLRYDSVSDLPEFHRLIRQRLGRNYSDIMTRLGVTEWVEELDVNNRRYDEDNINRMFTEQTMMTYGEVVKPTPTDADGYDIDFGVNDKLANQATYSPTQNNNKENNMHNQVKRDSYGNIIVNPTMATHGIQNMPFGKDQERDTRLIRHLLSFRNSKIASSFYVNLTIANAALYNEPVNLNSNQGVTCHYLSDVDDHKLPIILNKSIDLTGVSDPIAKASAYMDRINEIEPLTKEVYQVLITKFFGDNGMVFKYTYLEEGLKLEKIDTLQDHEEGRWCTKPEISNFFTRLAEFADDTNTSRAIEQMIIEFDREDTNRRINTPKDNPIISDVMGSEAYLEEDFSAKGLPDNNVLKEVKRPVKPADTEMSFINHGDTNYVEEVVEDDIPKEVLDTEGLVATLIEHGELLDTIDQQTDLLLKRNESDSKSLFAVEEKVDTLSKRLTGVEDMLKEILDLLKSPSVVATPSPTVEPEEVDPTLDLEVELVPELEVNVKGDAKVSINNSSDVEYFLNNEVSTAELGYHIFEVKSEEDNLDLHGVDDLSDPSVYQDEENKFSVELASTIASQLRLVKGFDITEGWQLTDALLDTTLSSNKYKHVLERFRNETKDEGNIIGWTSLNVQIPDSCVVWVDAVSDLQSVRDLGKYTPLIDVMLGDVDLKATFTSANVNDNVTYNVRFRGKDYLFGRNDGEWSLANALDA